jgi:hypothetical protein
VVSVHGRASGPDARERPAQAVRPVPASADPDSPPAVRVRPEHPVERALPCHGRRHEDEADEQRHRREGEPERPGGEREQAAERRDPDDSDDHEDRADHEPRDPVVSTDGPPRGVPPVLGIMCET